MDGGWWDFCGDTLFNQTTHFVCCTMAEVKVVPREDELVEAIKNLKLENPEFGIKKVFTKLSETHATWTVSEKRVKKLMQAQGLTQQNQHGEQQQQQQEQQQAEQQVEKSGVEGDPSIPVSFIDPKLDITSVSTSVVVRWAVIYCLKKPMFTHLTNRPR